jgi:flagellin-like protein
MNNRGISNVIAVVLLVALVLVTAGILFGVVVGLVRDSGSETTGAVVCLTEVDLEVSEACYSDIENTVQFNVKNKKDFDYDGGFFVVQISAEGNTEAYPTRLEVLGALEGKKFVVDYVTPSKIDEIFLIPRIRRKDYCLGKIVKFGLAECV